MTIALITYAVKLPDKAKEVPPEMAEAIPEGAPVACVFLKEQDALPYWGQQGQMLAESVCRAMTGVPAMTPEEERAAQQAALEAMG